MNTGPWQYRTEHTTATKKARVMQRMARKGWEYVEETKNPIFALRPRSRSRSGAGHENVPPPRRVRGRTGKCQQLG